MKLYIKRFPELTTDELYALLQVRSEVFVVEQNCVYQDLDYADPASIHLWLADSDGKILSMARVCPAGVHMEQISIGRVITTERGKGYGLRIMREAIGVARRYFDAETIDIEAQEYAKPFYEMVGFEQSSEPFILDGIPHIKMSYNFTSGVHIRRADLGDVALIADVVCAALGEELAEKLRGGLGMSLMEQVVAQPDTVYSYKNTLVAEINGVSVGAIIGYDGAKMWELRRPTFALIEKVTGTAPQLEEETGPGEFYLDSLAVLPEYQGQGIGATLISEASKQAFANGFSRVALLVDLANPNAERLYTRLGFHRDKPVTLLGHEMYHMVLEGPLSSESGPLVILPT